MVASILSDTFIPPFSRHNGFYKGVQSAGAAVAWQVDAHKTPLMTQVFWFSRKDCSQRILDFFLVPLTLNWYQSIALLRVVSLSLELTQSLDATQQGLTSLRHKVVHKPEQNETEPNPKRHCGSSEPQQKDEEKTVLGKDLYPDESRGEQSFNIDVTKSGTLKKARNMAINLVSKAATLASELKAIKLELCSVQGRCKLLEEENRRLRDGLENVVRPDEDDLVTLQLEALLVEKSKLANENANLVRENECLRQLVEYHQLAHEDDIPSPSSSSYEDEQPIHGVCLDFEDCYDECKERT